MAAGKAGRIAVRAGQARRPLQALNAQRRQQANQAHPPEVAFVAAYPAPKQQKRGDDHEPNIQRVAAKVPSELHGPNGPGRMHQRRGENHAARQRPEPEGS